MTITPRRVLTIYLLIGVVAGLWWWESTKDTGSSRTTRAVDAITAGLFWLPYLVILYGLRAFVWFRRHL